MVRRRAGGYMVQEASGGHSGAGHSGAGHIGAGHSGAGHIGAGHSGSGHNGLPPLKPPETSCIRTGA